MNQASVKGRTRPRLFWAWDLVLAAVLLLLLYMAFRSISALNLLLVAGAQLATLASLLAAAAIYFASHFIRIARLALISSDARLSLRLLTRVHLLTSGVGLALPFKLGDGYRAGELARATGSVVRGITLVFVERVFDVAMILLLLVLAGAFGPPLGADYAAVFVASLLFVSITLVVLVLVPDNLRRVSSYIIRRYDQEWTVRILRRIAELRAVIAGTATLLNGRYASLCAFTLLIWALEAMSLAIILGAFASDVEPLGALLAFLSSITEGETLLNRLGALELSRLSSPILAYLAATQIPLAFVALLAGLQLAVSRFTGQGWSFPRPRSRAG